MWKIYQVTFIDKKGVEFGCENVNTSKKKAKEEVLKERGVEKVIFIQEVNH